MGELEGFLDRDENRLYSLSEIGKKAVATINFINKDVDLNLLESVNTKRSQRLKEIRRTLDIGFYIVSALMIGIIGLMVYFSYVESDRILASFTGIMAVFSIGIIYLTNRSRKNDPEKILWLFEWLEWLLFRNYRNKG